ncbi:hypothetical protein Elgi_60210 [Paenibacillus elgii]|nr:hypothetical protein Elgi_60210 [Paenibacillus elgii]
MISLIQQKENFITKGNAAKILGIERGTVRRLIDVGILIAHKATSARFDQLRLDEINLLIDHCRGKLVRSNGKRLSFHQVLLKYFVYGLTAANLIEYTLAKTLAPTTTKPDGNLADNYYSDAEIRMCLHHIKQKKQEREGYNTKEVMRLLKIGESTLWRLVDNKSIAAPRIKVTARGRKRYHFEKTSVDRLAAENSIKMGGIAACTN